MPGQKRHKDMPYKFDHVFGPDATQEQVYEHTAGRVLDKVLSGFNVSHNWMHRAGVQAMLLQGRGLTCGLTHALVFARRQASVFAYGATGSGKVRQHGNTRACCADLLHDFC